MYTCTYTCKAVSAAASLGFPEIDTVFVKGANDAPAHAQCMSASGKFGLEHPPGLLFILSHEEGNMWKWPNMTANKVVLSSPPIGAGHCDKQTGSSGDDPFCAHNVTICAPSLLASLSKKSWLM